ncbi:MAG: hypothetical protein RJQ14_01395, partial [Marinoscillum sp.]
MIHIEVNTKRWIFFFQVLDSNKDGILEPVDIVNIVNRVREARPKSFTESDCNYIKAVSLKNFDRLLVEARSRTNRKITVRQWVDILD